MTPEASLLSVSLVAAQLCGKVPGGTGRYTLELLRALHERRKPHDELQAFVPKGCRPAGDHAVRTVELPAPAVLLSRLWEQNWPPRLPPTPVVHAPTLLVPPTRPGVALVVTVHDVVPWTHPETLTARGVRFHRRMGARAACDADVIVTPTRAVASEVRQHLEPRCPVVTIPPGTTPAIVPPDAVERRAALGIDRPYVLFVGTAEPRKGLDALVSAMSRPTLADLDLVVVGPPGWGDVDVRRLASSAGVEGRVIVTGYVDDLDLASCYDGARVLAVPSRAEGFGLPVVEAMSHGVPVVTSRDAALQEVGSDAAVAIDIRDIDALAAACADVAADGARRRGMVERGAARALDFSWFATAEAMWALYRRAFTKQQEGRTG